MQFTLISVLFLATGAFATAGEELEARMAAWLPNCGQIVASCAGGSAARQGACRCPGQAAPCDIWQCPGGADNFVSLLAHSYIDKNTD